MKNLIFLFIALFVFYGCNKQTQTEKQQSTVYGNGILQILDNAANGDAKANSRLSDILELKFAANKNYNHITIDSIINYNGKRIYMLLMEHSIPVYNRFAVYDENLHCYLMDKSLNGYLKSTIYRSEGEVMIQVDENFTSKDVFELMRRSLYLLKNDTASLAFRNFVELKTDKKEFTQDITVFKKDTIATALNINGEKDTDLFIFDQKILKYVSGEEKFSKFVFREIDDYKKPLKKPQIQDERTALESAGITPKEDTINNTNNFKNSEDGFTVFIPEDWKVIKGFTITNPLKKQIKGTYFTSMSRGAKFYVIKMPEGDSAETFTGIPFTNFVKGKYFVRFTEKTEAGNNYFLFFEISCSTKKFLVFFEAPKLIYEENKVAFESIINSFGIDC